MSRRASVTAAFAALCVVLDVLLALDVIAVPGPVTSLEVDGSFFTGNPDGLYVLWFSLSQVAVSLALALGVGALIGRWWAPLLLLLPLLASLSQVDGRRLPDAIGDELVRGAQIAGLGFIATAFAAQAIAVLAGVGARKFVGRRAA